MGRHGRDASSAGVTVRLGLFPPASARGLELSDTFADTKGLEISLGDKTPLYD